MTCGLVLTGETRALVEGQFTLHIDEKHKRKLNDMKPLALKFFEGEPPKVERKVRVKKEREDRSKWTEGEEVAAEWI